MKKIAIIVGNNMNDYDVFVPLDLWTKAGLIVNLISIEKKNSISLESGFKISCSTTIDKVNLLQFHGIYIPGGLGVENFSYKSWPQKDNEILKKFINSLSKIIENTENKYLLLTEESSLVLNELEVLVDFNKNTIFNEEKEAIKLIGNTVFVKGKIILNDFAIEVAKLLLESKNKDKLNRLETLIFN